MKREEIMALMRIVGAYLHMEHNEDGNNFWLTSPSLHIVVDPDVGASVIEDPAVTQEHDRLFPEALPQTFTIRC